VKSMDLLLARGFLCGNVIILSTCDAI